MKVLFATKNPSKVKFYGEPLLDKGIELLTIKDLEENIEVDECGNNPEENAIIKARAYYDLTGLITVAVDDGLFFEDLEDKLQPGTHVRRVNGKELNDEEMIDYYTNLVDKYGINGEMKGYFLKSVAIIIDGEVYTYSEKLYKIFTNKVSEKIDKGYPLDSITFEHDFNKFSSEMSEEERRLKKKSTRIKEFILDKVIKNS